MTGVLKAAVLRALHEWRSGPHYSHSHSLVGILDNWATLDDHPTKAVNDAAAKFASESIDSLADAIVAELKSDER